MRFVLNANVALTWFLSEGEAQTPYSLLVLEDAVEGNTCVVPGLWHAERVAFLFELYRKYTSLLPASGTQAAKRRVAKKRIYKKP